METTFLVILALLIVLISVWFVKSKNTKNKLPGPAGLPIVGYLPFMTKKPHIKLTELSETYGPVYRLRLGSIDVVVITDFELMKEAFTKDSFMGRPPDLPFDISKVTLETGAFTDLPWKEQKRFVIHMLRDLGFGKTRMEEHLKEEILEIVERMSEHVGKPTEMTDILTPSMSNNIASLIFGRRLKYNDPMRQQLDHLVRDVGRFAGAVSWQLFFPWIRAFMKIFRVGNSGKLSHSLILLREYCMNEIDRHEATLNTNDIRDLVDGYLLEIQKKSGDPNTTFRKEVLADVSRGFFAAGSETVRATVDWVLLICAAYPEVQKKIQAEIDEVLGQDRFPTWQDRLRMPYTEAALSEVIRWKTIVPLNIMHYTLQDTEINGYSIPKHTRVLSVIWAVDHSEKLWGKDVHEYKPERFLSKDGQKVVKPEYFIPFSIGRRACPGKSLAEIEIFLYTATILQKFEVFSPPGKEIDLEGILGVGHQIKKQPICLKLRK